MESKTTSKTSYLKALLLKAWRERWTDLQWGINIKTVLPRGVSGDVYNLADCIMQQAVVGSGTNQLVLSYLKHSLSAQLVSHAAVLQRLSKYTQWYKTHCMYSLLEFLEGILPGMTCCGKPEETILATALLSIAFWLLQVLEHCNNVPHVFEKASTIFRALLSSDFYVAMMCIARYNDTKLFAEINEKCLEMKSRIQEHEGLGDFVQILEYLDVKQLPLPVVKDTGPGCMIQAWVAMELIQRPDTPSPILAEQLFLLQRLQGYSKARLCAELMRGSLVSLHNVSQTPYESQWGAFAFLKVPSVLAIISDKCDSTVVVEAVELLLQHTPLLDSMDASCSCSSLECLLSELCKAQCLTESQVERLSARRVVPMCLKLDSAPANAGIPKVIICAEPTLAGILKTLSTDHHKEALLGMLHQVLTGKSFELILAVATVQGQLRTLAARLIRFNECSKIGSDKARSQLFDISFLMLVFIVQNYSAEAVLEAKGQTLLEQWIKECMVEPDHPKSPEQLLRLCNETVVNNLLQQFNSGEPDFKSPVKWQDVLFNMAGVMKEVLVAWEQGTLVASDVKRILDAVRGRMCCLPVAAAAWLCAYMRTVPQDTLLKPINMVQQLLAPPVAEDDNLRERWQLTCEIIRKMQRTVQLPLQLKGSCHLVFQQPAAERFCVAWRAAIKQGWLDHSSSRTIQCLHETAGSRWLVSAVFQEILSLRYRDKLERGVELALAIFHLNIHNCTIQLLTHVLPQHLCSCLQSQDLMEPQLSAFARLTSFCVYASCVLDESEGPPAKIQRLNDKTDRAVTSALRQLLVTLGINLHQGCVTQQTYFAFHLLNFLVCVDSPSTVDILSSVPPQLISDLLKTLPDLFTPTLLVRLHNIQTVAGRTNMARDLCTLRNHQLKKINAGGS